MPTLHEYYQILGLSPGASLDQVKQAYLKLARQWHPDRFVENLQQQQIAEEKFKAISHAYDQLRSILESPAYSSQVRSQIKEDPDALYQEATRCVEENDLQLAIEALTQAIRLRPDYLKAYQYRAFLNEQLGYVHRAASDFKKVQELKGSTPPSGSSRSTTASPSITHWQQVRVLRGHSQAITRIIYSSDGKMLVSGSQDKTIKLWPLDGGRIRYTLPGYEGPVHDLSLRRDGQAVIAACGDKVLRWWDLSSRKMHRLGRMGAHSGPILTVAFSPDGEKVISAGVDKTVKLWQFSTGKVMTTLEGYSEPISLIAVSPTGTTFITNGEGKLARIRSMQGGHSLRWLSLDSPLKAAAFSPDGQQIATATATKLILWQVNSAQPIHDLGQQIKPISALAFSPRGDLLAASDGDQIKLWQVETGDPLPSLSEGHEQITSLAWHPNGEELLGGRGDGSIQVWHPQE